VSGKVDSSEFDSRLNRRELLGLLGVASLAALVAGCARSTGITGKRNLPESYAGTYSPTAIVPDRESYAPPTLPTPARTKPLPTLPTNSFGIIPRTAWAGDGPNMKTIDPMNGIGLLTFHHSGDPKAFTENEYSETAAHLEYVRQYHRSRGFQDIGYHFAIDRMGRVWQLRSLKYQGQHVRYNNEHNIGVVVLGNFDLQKPTQAQLDRIRTFGNLLRKQYVLPIDRVKTHREIVSTECPGDYMQPYMVRIRREGLI